MIRVDEVPLMPRQLLPNSNLKGHDLRLLISSTLVVSSGPAKICT